MRIPLYSSNRVQAREGRAFTMIELVLVLFIMLLLVTVIAPSFSSLLKRSRVKQATEIVMTALFRARAEAQRYRKVVAVYFGDDESQLKYKPPAGILPKYGEIEVWLVAGHNGDNVGDSGVSPLVLVAGHSTPASYPFCKKLRLLTPTPFTFPEGVRIITGQYDGSTDNFYFGNYDGDLYGNLGEVKRHHMAYSRRGAMVGAGTSHCYHYVLVYDTATGEHSLIWCGEWFSNARPLLLNERVRQVNGTTLTSASEINNIINSVP